MQDDKCNMASHHVGDHIQAVIFDRVKKETLNDKIYETYSIYSSWFSWE